ncbi:MAG: PilZ domain-containing protein [Alkalispirochaeta sp.]
MLGDISRGFNTTTSETYIFLAMIAGIVVVLVLYQLYRRHRNTKIQEERKKNPPEPLLRSYAQTRRDLIHLSSREQRTLDHLAWFLKDPSNQNRLIDDDAMLLKAARKGIREGIVTEVEVLRLLNKLEVDSAVLTAGGRSSSSIPAGSEVSISDRNLNMAVGELLLGTDQGVSVRIDKGRTSFPLETPVEVVCNSPDGMYHFHSVVKNVEDKHLLLQHSRYVEHVQRRKYRRRESELPVTITIPGVSVKPIRSKTADISIGGAAIKNPRKKIISGTRIDCTVDAESATPITVPGTALRTSQRGKIVHVSFGPLDDKTRHRLFRKLIRLGSDETR